MGKVGNRVRERIERPARELVDMFREASPPDVADAMGKTGATRGIGPTYTPVGRCVGPA
ncbi:MAG: hypothetical protein M0Z94_17855 [Dehalococcoidales bacterium]|nr:hypothetical protein [Dehalococcoidales bacterium]